MNEWIVSAKKNINRVTKSERNKGIFTITIAAIALGFAVNYLVIAAGILSSGAAGIAQGISYTIVDITGVDESLTVVYYWIINLAINIPIIIFTYRTYGWKLLGYSLYVFFLSLIVSISIGYIPGFKDVNIIPEVDQDLNPFAYTVRIYILSMMAGVVYGISLGVIFVKGATSLGLDPIIRYLSREKRINIGKIIFTITVVNSFIWTMVLTYINSENVSFITDVLFNPTFIGTLIFISLYSFIMSKIYSIKKLFLLEINSEKYKDISKKLNSINYHRGHTINIVIGGFSNKERGILKIIVNIEEIDDVIRIATTVDDNSFIYATEVSKVQTKKIVYWNPITSSDLKHKEKYDKEISDLQDIKAEDKRNNKNKY